MTQKSGRSFTYPHALNQVVNHSYDSASGRIAGWWYDADGRFIADTYIVTVEAYIYDEAGLLRSSGLYESYNRFEFDGDGQKAKTQTAASNVYLLRSSVIGQTISEIDPTNGTKFNGFVYADGELVAMQSMGQIYWQHRDVSGKSVRTTDANQDETGRDELDPSGVKVDGPGQEHHGGGSGGGLGHDPGGIQARAASLMNIATCDFARMAVPCAIKDSLTEQIGLALEAHQKFWEYGWWSGASHGTAYMYYANNAPFRLMDMLKKPVKPTLKYPKPTPKGEGKRRREHATVGPDETDEAQKNPERLSRENVDTLRTNLEKFLQDKDCGNFINAVLNYLPEEVWKTERQEGTLLDAFDRIRNDGGFWSKDLGASTGEFDPNVGQSGSINYAPSMVPLITTGRSDQRFATTTYLIHELVHGFTDLPNSGAYGHDVMARAARDAVDSLGIDLKAALIGFPGTGASSGAYSDYFDRTINYACRNGKL